MGFQPTAILDANALLFFYIGEYIFGRHDTNRRATSKMKEKKSFPNRRTFIETTGKLSAGAITTAMVAGGFFTGSPAMARDPDKKLGVALVGLGSLSTKQIAPALQKTAHCRLAGIVSGTPEKRKKWASQYDLSLIHI